MKQPTKTNSNDKVNQIVVAGASSGGLDAFQNLIKQLPADFPAPILLVLHISADSTGKVLLNALNKIGKLKCQQAKDGEQIKVGHIYIAIPDHHLMIKKGGKLMVTKGAQENRSRPAIDPLFRSAAVAFGNKAVGILLTGNLDDGTSGLTAIQRCGGICIVQDPEDAEYSTMPQSAINQLTVDYTLPILEMGPVLFKLMERKIAKQKPIPKDIIREVMIAQRVLSDLPSVNALGEQVPFNCPGCGGVLWKINKGPATRYRCHTGHAYTAAVLLAEQTAKIEETMWIALRMFEERKNLLTVMASEQTGPMSKRTADRAKDSQIHIDRIRAILLTTEKTQPLPK